jgi:vacuolar-type H+-ATPase subunit E/Vma4
MERTKETSPDTGKEKLIREIEENARQEAEKIISEAEKTAKQRIAAAEGRCERMKREAEERAEKKRRDIESHNTSAINIRLQRIRLKQTEEIIQKVFDTVEGEIDKRVGNTEYVRVLEEWAVEAVLGVGTENVVISTTSDERAYITKEFISRVEEQVRTISGKKVNIHVSDGEESEYGICARSENGRLEYRNQVKSRLSRNKMYYRKLINEKLGIEGT